MRAQLSSLSTWVASPTQSHCLKSCLSSFSLDFFFFFLTFCQTPVRHFVNPLWDIRVTAHKEKKTNKRTEIWTGHEEGYRDEEPIVLPNKTLSRYITLRELLVVNRDVMVLADKLHHSPHHCKRVTRCEQICDGSSRPGSSLATSL